MSLVTAASAPIAPPAAILGLTYFFVKWVSTSVLKNVYVCLDSRSPVANGNVSRPPVQCLLMTYTLDLVLVLKSLFDFTLAPNLSGSLTWNVLKEAFEAYEQSESRRRIHDNVSSNFRQGEGILTADCIRKKVREMLHQYAQCSA